MVGPAHVPLAALIVPFGLHLICTTSALMAKANHCAEGWKFYSGKCYYFSTYKKTWTASRDACVAEGADLVIITSTEEHTDYIDAQCDEHDGDDGRGYAGINVSLQVWVWSDESNYTYNDWGPGEPNNIGSDNCVQLYNNYSDKWNDAGCNYTCPFVCYKSE
uniref:C-type lectin domain-containing protein n=1 Tax=Electrophorus electricus TaxID=8005 RepID=A0AAY5EAC2_ELEEL